jgi:hypothetical protein
MNDDAATQHLQKHRDLSVHMMNNISHNDNFYNCIGTYTVKRKDIMYATDDCNEMEVVVNPKDVKLIDYNFLNIFDYISQSLLLSYITQTKTGRSGLMNIDNFYSYVRKLVKKVVIDEPNAIIQTLQRTAKTHHSLAKLFSGSNLHTYEMEDEYDNRKKKYLICSMDENDENPYFFGVA